MPRDYEAELEEAYQRCIRTRDEYIEALRNTGEAPEHLMEAVKLADEKLQDLAGIGVMEQLLDYYSEDGFGPDLGMLDDAEALASAGWGTDEDYGGYHDETL